MVKTNSLGYPIYITLEEKYGKKYPVNFDSESFNALFGGDSQDVKEAVLSFFYSIPFKNGQIIPGGSEDILIFCCNSLSVACELSSAMGDKIKYNIPQESDPSPCICIHFKPEYLDEVMGHIDTYERSNNND